MAGECYNCGGRKRTLGFGGMPIPCSTCCCWDYNNNNFSSLNEIIEKEPKVFDKKTKKNKGYKDDE